MRKAGCWARRRAVPRMSSRPRMWGPSWRAGWTGCCGSQPKGRERVSRHMATNLAAAIAVNRFGLGAKPGELAAAGADSRDWLKAQLQGRPPVLSGAGLEPASKTLANVLELR